MHAFKLIIITNDYHYHYYDDGGSVTYASPHLPAPPSSPRISPRIIQCNHTVSTMSGDKRVDLEL